MGWRGCLPHLLNTPQLHSPPPNSDVICQSMISRFFFLFFFRLGESKGVSHVTVSHVTHFLACVMMLYHVYFCRVCVLWVHNESSLSLGLCAIRKVGCVSPIHPPSPTHNSTLISSWLVSLDVECSACGRYCGRVVCICGLSVVIFNIATGSGYIEIVYNLPNIFSFA